MFAQQGLLWREMLRLQSHWFIHSFISVEVPKNKPSHEMGGEHNNHRLRSPTQAEGLHTMVCDLIPQGDRLRHCCHYPSAMQPSARCLSTLAWVDQSSVSQRVS